MNSHIRSNACLSLLSTTVLLTTVLLTTVLCCSSCTSRSSNPQPIHSTDITLSNGNIIRQYTLSNDQCRVSFIPALGGKITSLQSANGREYLSRSDRPYTMRRYGMKYTESEYDGIDECFPSLDPSAYPLAPWHDRPIPDHGELCQLEWSLIASSDDSITLAVDGKGFPYTFTRTAQLKNNTLTLSYSLVNHSANDFHCLYTFHPLFAGEDRCGIIFNDTDICTVERSSDDYLGAGSGNNSPKWNQFVKNQYQHGSGKSYRYHISNPQEDSSATLGSLQLSYANGDNLLMTWPKKILPALSVSSSQGAHGGLEYISPQISTSQYSNLAEAHRNKDSIIVRGNRSLKWKIEIRINNAPEPLL